MTSEQRLEFTSIPEQISEYELGSYCTLSPHDIEIIKHHRRDHNKLGCPLQLCVLRFPGWTLSDVQHIGVTIHAHQLKKSDYPTSINLRIWGDTSIIIR
ncbi:DUF4158 domain-containing protein [Bacillus cereus]|nr:DUF4158 domain-containing protein [Bacillus cereus]